MPAERFTLDRDEMNERHHLTFDTYEEGKRNLHEYLDRVVFYEKRLFTREDFKDFMYAQSRPFPEMIDLICRLKARYHLKVAVVSNEGRELTEYRIAKFRLADFIDFFIASCFVHFRKPDADIYRIALDIAQVAPTAWPTSKTGPCLSTLHRAWGFVASFTRRLNRRGMPWQGWASSWTHPIPAGIDRNPFYPF